MPSHSANAVPACTAPAPPTGDPALRPTLIMGVGNTLQGDDGVGVHALHWLHNALGAQPGIHLYDAGTLGATLLVEIEQTRRLIFIDAMRMNTAAGTVRCFEGAAMDQWLRRAQAGSVHEVSLGELLDMARLLDRLPPRRALIGIEPGPIGWGEHLSAELTGALPQVEHCVRDVLRRWTDETA
ncbi:MAG: HyaD/HybD family hydrogenase maturation endopeptidase [Metallibacterium scheffleri]